MKQSATMNIPLLLTFCFLFLVFTVFGTGKDFITSSQHRTDVSPTLQQCTQFLTLKTRVTLHFFFYRFFK